MTGTKNMKRARSRIADGGAALDAGAVQPDEDRRRRTCRRSPGRRGSRPRAKRAPRQRARRASDSSTSTERAISRNVAPSSSQIDERERREREARGRAKSLDARATGRTSRRSARSARAAAARVERQRDRADGQTRGGDGCCPSAARRAGHAREGERREQDREHGGVEQPLGDHRAEDLAPAGGRARAEEPDLEQLAAARGQHVVAHVADRASARTRRAAGAGSRRAR